MLRVAAAVIGLSLATLWVLGLCLHATVWLTWVIGIAASLSLAIVGLIPERRGALWGAFFLGFLGAGLVAASVSGLSLHATRWLSWWAFVAAGAAAATALVAAAQGLMEAASG
jgi:hypothetical protein